MEVVQHPAFASLTFAILCSLVQIALGALIGWRIGIFRETRRAVACLTNDDARDLLDRLHILTSETAQGVGAHSTRVREISRDLDSIPEDTETPQATILQAAAQILLANEKLQAELATAQSELEEHAKMIESHMVEARTDGLVNVPNRRALDEELNRRFVEWERGRVPLVLLMADIDHFKRFNDQHGHQAGDAVLREVGQTLSRTLGDVAFVARYGGEEFAVVFRPNVDLPAAQQAAERARLAIAEQLCEFEAKVLRVTISLGLATVEADDDLTLLVKHADEALYNAKAAGRNQVRIFERKSPVPAVPNTLAEAASAGEIVADAEESSGRRAGARKPYHSKHHVAPYRDGKLPKMDSFYEVECYNISAGGFSFFAPSRPDFDSVVVALQVEDTINYLTARIMHTVQSATDRKPMYIVGCRFTGRVEIANSELEPVAAEG